MVNREGKSRLYTFRPFLPKWKTFSEISKRYEGLNEKYDHYTLDEVIELQGK